MAAITRRVFNQWVCPLCSYRHFTEPLVTYCKGRWIDRLLSITSCQKFPHFHVVCLQCRASVIEEVK